MKEFINPLNFIPSIDEYNTPKQHGVNIVDFETVCYDKANFEQGRSLSLNFCNYEKILEPCHLLESAKYIDKPQEERKNGIGELREAPTKKSGLNPGIAQILGKRS